MKNIMKFVLVFALAAGFAACSKNAKQAPMADMNAAGNGEITEIAADETVVIDEEEPGYGVGMMSGASTTLTPVYFTLNQYTLSKEARAILEKNAEVLKVKGAKIVIEGNCDDRGTIAYNIALGDKRAKEVKDYYVKLGIPAANVAVVSYGEEKPVCTAQTEACWAENRRADTVIK